MPKAKKKVRPSNGGWIAALLVLAVLGGVAADAWQQLRAPLPLAQPATVELALGERLDALLERMQQQGTLANVRQRIYLSLYARALRKTAQIKAGEYALAPGLNPLGLMDLLISGKVVLHQLLLVEGWRFNDAWRQIAQDPNLAHTLPDSSAPALIAVLGGAANAPEGQLFPDTYLFPKGTTDAAFLHRAHAALQKILAAEWAARAPDLPLTDPQQALILASLVEKETAAPAERAKIAGVFVRRLRIGMRLQTDPAVIYGLGDGYTGTLHTDDLRTDTPYNTYTRAGLPPTPICLPGRDSIHAAMHPEAGDALYFVSRGDGTHQFSATLDEQNAAVQHYVIEPYQHRQPR